MTEEWTRTEELDRETGVLTTVEVPLGLCGLVVVRREQLHRLLREAGYEQQETP